MNGLEIILKFNGNNAFLSDDRPIPIKNLDLPDIIESFKYPVSWLIKIIKYHESEKLIYAEILKYFNSELEFTDYQLKNENIFTKIAHINFRSVNTSQLLSVIKTEDSEVSDYKNDYPNSEDLFITTIDTDNKYDNNIKKINQKEIKFSEFVNFSIPFKELKFEFGCVSFSKKVKFHDVPIKFSIINIDIRAEFDAIKNYFSNFLKSKRINVFAEIVFVNGDISEIKASSPEISKINNKTIDSVKFEFVGDFLKKRRNFDIDKSLFTMDECFALMNSNENNTNAFYKNDKDLFDDILQISDTKHYKHLRFLSSKHAYKIMKLRFVLKPFSFIFLIEGEKMFHIIWETLDTEEASYIWHVEKNKEKLKLKLNQIEDIINIIKVQGKTAYINSKDENYHRIYHDYSEIVDGFVKWKSEIESFLI